MFRTGLCLLALLLPGAGSAGPAEPPEPVRLDEFGEPEEPQELRERMTEREDENRVENPWSSELFGRSLTVFGEYEILLDWASRAELGDDSEDAEDLLLEQGLEVEAFYALGGNAFLFAQGTLGYERQLHAPGDPSQIESTFVERGETWIHFQRIAGKPVQLEIGSLDFEDDRTWWWDDDLDAVRLEYEGPVDVELAVARELGARRSDQDGVEPERERVLRFIAEASWEWSEDHALELYAIHQHDHSRSEGIGSVVREEDEDDSDASLTWLGPRATGAFASPARGTLAYWADAALVEGRELLLDYEDLPGLGRGRAIVVDRTRHDVRGWAFDAGLTFALARAFEPRFTLGVAVGSGDATPGGGKDRSFRQTGLGSNEVGFGGVQRFVRYGFLLAPELSNLRVLSAGFGISLLRASSLDLTFHDYRQLEATDELRDARLELTLDGQREHVGSELDLVLALEEWEHLELELVGSVFRAGSAVGELESQPDGRRGRSHDDWSYGGFVALRWAF
jgi:alginate production protein